MAGIPKRKDEDAEFEEGSPFADCRKNVVLREARIFHEPQLSTSKCQQVLTRLLYLLNMGDTFGNEEATELFFATTKLFQATDVHLRRLTYLLLKSLNIDSDCSLIVVSCLSKDMTSRVDLFRANSIRVLQHIINDGSMVAQLDRFLKQSLVDKNPLIVSSVLVFGLAVYKYAGASDLIKRWVNEVSEALNSRSSMVCFHALALLHRIRSADRLAIIKILAGLSKQTNNGQTIFSPLASITHLRILSQLLTSGNNAPNTTAELLKQVLDLLHCRHPIVSLEAARILTRLPFITGVQLVSAVSVLQEFLSSVIPTHRFAAVRTLSQIVSRFPLIVAPCVLDLEHLISDQNRSIATLAITTLLKTGQEQNVDRLMKSISSFMQEIADEFKIILVDAIRALCLKFPAKHPLLLNFLAQALREEGGFKYKKALVEAMVSIISAVPESAESGLGHFCEFIEDCEFSELAVTILHLLGDRGPLTPNPAQYIRFIFNRVILETASVRAAAVSAIAKFGAACPHLRENCIVLLKRCILDNDDEMRDRAIFYLTMLSDSGGIQSFLATNQTKPLPKLTNFEYSLQTYLDTPSSINIAFSLDRHIKQAPPSYDDTDVSFTTAADAAATDSKDARAAAASASPSASSASSATASSKPTTGTNAGASMSAATNPYAAVLSAIPALRELGTVFKSSEVVELTESETEYVVTCIKHVFRAHVVFQFNVTLNMEDQELSNVSVEMELSDDNEAAATAGWTEELSVVEPKLIYQVQGVTYVAFNRPANSYAASLSCTLHFTVHDVDTSGGERIVSDSGHTDEYQLEQIEVSEADFMRPGDNMGLVEFKRQWESLSDSNEVIKRYNLGADSLQAAVTAVLDLLGMTACEGSQTVPDGARTHSVNATGVFFPNTPVLARTNFVLDAKPGVMLKLAVRSENGAINTMLTDAIR